MANVNKSRVNRNHGTIHVCIEPLDLKQIEFLYSIQNMTVKSNIHSHRIEITK